MSISVTNFLLKYLRPVLISATDFTDAILGYWIDQALIDISRSFPRKTYALWDTVIHQQSYGYADSTTITDDATIIRVLNCLYPWVSDENPGISLVRKSYLDSDFYGGDYYEPDNDFQMLYVGPRSQRAKKYIAIATSSGRPQARISSTHPSITSLSFCSAHGKPSHSKCTTLPQPRSSTRP